MRQAAVEVKVTAGLLLGLGLAYLVLGIVIVATSEASPRTVILPIASVVLGGLVAGGLALRMPSSRFFGFGVAALFAILHAFLLLGSTVIWFKIFSGLLAAGYVYTIVLLNSGPMRRYLYGANV